MTKKIQGKLKIGILLKLKLFFPYRHSYAAIVCYDPLDLESYQKVKYWIQELQKISTGTKIYICATKHDITEAAKKKVVVDARDVQELIQEYDAKYFETSAKTGTNVKELFYDIAYTWANDPTTSMTFFGDYDKSFDHHGQPKISSCC